MKDLAMSAESRPMSMSALQVVRVVLSTLFHVSTAAAVAATTLSLLFAMKEGVWPFEIIERFFVLLWLVTFAVAWLHALLLGVPAAILLQRTNAYRAAPMCAAGALIGCVPVVWIGQPNPASLIFPASAAVGALAFYWASRNAMPNRSLSECRVRQTAKGR